MKRQIVFAAFLFCITLSATAQMRHFSIYVDNTSDFDIRCEGKTEKGEGIFSKYASVIKKHQRFAFVIESNKKVIPKGVEGTIRFRVDDPKYGDYAEVYFDNPILGGPTFKINTIPFPLAMSEFPISQINDVVVLPEKAVAIKISVDTSKRVSKVTPLQVGKGSKPADPKGTAINTGDEPIPEIINFEWQVDQRSRKDNDDDDGPPVNEVTYLFTSDGQYAAVRPKGKSFTLMIYTPKGHTWLVDENRKTIMVMSMPKTVGEGGMMGKKIAEDIKRSPLEKDNDDEKFTITKTGKTKQIQGYPADEYLFKNNKVKATKNAEPGASFWYAKVPFDPVKVYTMGAGRPADLSSLQNNPRMKNNITAIPVLNKNYLMAETEAGGVKGLETTGIKHGPFTFRTAGYTIKVAKSMRDLMEGGN